MTTGDLGMTIKELETMTGVTKQNIRFYEKKGLLKPGRNPENDYREYTEKDVEQLRRVKIFRMLDMPIEEIKKLLDREIPMEDVMKQHLLHLAEEEQHLKDAMEICRLLQNRDLETMDANQILSRMSEIEKQGGTFKTIIDDYKKVAAAERMKTFSFEPDLFVRNKREFTEALFQYAEEQNLNLVVTKESMYPVFEIDGVEYTATRNYGRFGAVIRCEMTHPEEAEALDVPEKNRQRYKWLYRMIGPTILWMLLLSVIAGWPLHDFAMTGILLGIIIYGAYYFYYRHL